MTPPHFSHDVKVPTGFDLELDSLITQGQVSIYAFQELVQRRLNAEADAHRYP